MDNWNVFCNCRPLLEPIPEKWQKESEIMIIYQRYNYLNIFRVYNPEASNTKVYL